MKEKYKQKTQTLLTFYFLGLTLFGVSAKEISKNERITPYGVLTYISSTPTSGTNYVSRSADIVLTFNEAVASGTLNNTNIKVSGSQTGTIAASFSGGGTTQVTINPTTDFKAGELITVTLLLGLQSNATADALSNPYTIQFTAAALANDYYSLPIAPVQTTIASINSAQNFYPVDLDSDGDMDIVSVADNADALYWYRNEGTESFTQIELDSGSLVDGIWSLFVKDMDGDGDMDILAASGKDGTMAYYLNDGSQNFTRFSYSHGLSGGKFRNVHIADLDNDGDEDIAYISNSSDNVIWLENTGTGTGNLIFGGPMFLDTGATGVWGLDVKDMDKDGDLDVLISTAQSGTVNIDRISWYENNGAKSFTKHDITTTVDKVRSVFAIDVDDDGDMDFLSSSADDDTVSWYQNNGNQAFTKIDIDINSDNVQKVTASDVDGDGDIDIMSASGSDDVIALYLNNGSEVFTKKVITNLLDGARTVGTVDLDSDGDLDILAASVNDNLLVWYENKLNSWTGTTDTDWDTTTNWSLGAIPTGTTDVIIPAGISISAAGNINVQNLIIESGASLTVTGSVNNTGNVILKSGSSIIAKSSMPFDIEYNRALATANWYTVSSAVTNETIENIISNHSFAKGSGSNIGVSDYDNTIPGWTYATLATTGTIASGEGRAVKLASLDDLSFTGNMPTSDIDIAITHGGGGGNGFNLIGNPYPSYIPLNTITSAGADNVLDANASVLEEQTVYLWDQSLNSYTALNQASTSRYIAPGQGFFVQSKAAGGTFNFTEAMQSHQATDVFNRTENTRPEIKLAIANGSDTSATDIYYIEGTTLSFDNGYDSSMFGGVSNDFTVYTHLLVDSQGQDLAIQSLPDSDFESMVIPLGVNAVSGTALVFTAESINIPNGLDVILEDRQEQTFTILSDTNTQYSVTLKDNSNGIGRFYLHTNTQATLGLEIQDLTNVSVYKTSASNLRITGLDIGIASMQLYNTLGQSVFSASFEGASVNDVALPNLKAGIYIVDIKTGSGKLNKKIILQ
jgi:hypothetical protein